MLFFWFQQPLIPFRRSRSLRFLIPTEQRFSDVRVWEETLFVRFSPFRKFRHLLPASLDFISRQNCDVDISWWNFSFICKDSSGDSEIVLKWKTMQLPHKSFLQHKLEKMRFTNYLDSPKYDHDFYIHHAFFPPSKTGLVWVYTLYHEDSRDSVVFYRIPWVFQVSS